MFEIKRSLAIIIGINDYEHIPRLKTAKSDAIGLASVLKDIYGYKVLLLLDRRATKEKLSELVANLKQKTISFDNKPIQVNECDRILFYFAGHGFAEAAQDSEAGKPAGYFMPQDAESDDKKTWLSMQQLYEAFSNLNCHHLLMILDCCFAGRISWLGQGRNAARSRKLYRQSYDRFIKHKTEQIITSAAHDEEAQDTTRFGLRGEENGNSPFAHLLLKVLQGNSERDKDKFIKAIVEDGVITTQELFAYLQNKLGAIAQAQTPGLSKPRKYDPETGEYVYLKGEYIFPLPKFNPERLNQLKLNRNTNPYKGLASFDTADSNLFFGRTLLSQQLAEKVTEQPLTIVLGASGSGKSSLVKAGLIPILTEDWHILDPMRPSGSPFKELNKILTQSESGSSIVNLSLPEKIKHLFQKISSWVKRNSKSKLLLVIDQSEELLTLNRDRQEQKDFLNLLAESLNKYPQLRIVLTLRSDFESQIKDVVEDEHWQQAWQQGRFNVTPMNREELQLAIEEPAAQRTLFFESPKLVSQIIDETIDRTGILPLLSFTLSELYLKYLQAEENGARSDRTITEADYLELGGVESSLAQAAKRTYRELVKQKINPPTINNVMLRMVSLDGSEITRRRVRKSELNYPEPIDKDVEIIIDCFVAARLFTTGKDTEDTEYVEPVHDALVTRWEKLISKPETQENLLLQRRLTPAAEEWNDLNVNLKSSDRTNKVKAIINWLISFTGRSQNKPEHSQEKSEKYLWNASPYLDVLNQEVLNSAKNNWLNQVETEFVQHSVKQRRQNIQKRWFAISIAMTLLSGATIWAVLNLRNARIQEISTLIKTSEANLQANNQLDAIVEAIKAKKKFDRFWLKNDRLSLRVLGILGQTVHYNQQGWRERLRLTGSRVAFSPDGKLIATKNYDTAKIWNAQTGKQLLTLEKHTEEIDSIVFSPNGQQLAIASGEEVLMWDAQTGNYLYKVQGQNFLEHAGNRTNLVFSPEGQRLATVSDDKVLIWNAQTGKSKSFPDLSLPENSKVSSMAFSADGKLLATALEEEVLMWNVQTGESLPSLPKKVESVVFNPNGKQLATASKNTVLIWNIQAETKFYYYYPLEPEDTVKSIVFSSDGQKLAAVLDNKTVQVWNIPISESLSSVAELRILMRKSGRSIVDLSLTLASKTLRIHQSPLYTIQGHTADISAVVFSPDNQKLATASEDKTAQIWDAKTGNFLHELQGHTDGLFSVAFSPDGQQLATASRDLTVSLWTVTPDELLYDLPKNKDELWSGAFSPDGQQLATTSDDNTVKIWDVNNWQQLSPPLEHKDRVKNVFFSPDGQRLATASNDNTVRIWDVNNWQQLFPPIMSTNSIDSMAFSSNSQQLQIASISSKNTVLRQTVPISDAKRTEVLFSLKDESKDEIKKVVFSPDGQLMATLSDNDSNETTLKVWDLKNGRKLYSLKLPIQSFEKALVFSSDSRKLATLWQSKLRHKTVRILDARRDKEILTLEGNTDRVSSMAFSHDDRQLVTLSSEKGSSNLRVRTWNTKTGEQLQTSTVDEQVGEQVIFSPDGQRLVTLSSSPDKNPFCKDSCKDYSIQAWQVGDIEKMMALNCDWVRHYLKSNPNLDDGDRTLCDDVPELKQAASQNSPTPTPEDFSTASPKIAE